MAHEIRTTYCRICEAHCGLKVEVNEEDEVVRVRPDKTHPVSKGFACIKGLGIGSLHDDPDRVNYPMKRTGSRWQRIGWEQATGEIGERVQKLRAAHGNRSVALYQGNPTFFSFQNILFSSGFLEALHSPNLFASHSVDANNKFEVATQVYGHSVVHPVADLGNTQFFMCLGSNPMVSQMSVIQVVNPLERLRAIEARGGKVVIVDPRRTETAKRVGEHVSIRPGTDVYLLLGLLHVIAHENEIDLAFARGHANDVDRFVGVAQTWPPDRVARVTDINAETIRRLANAYRTADGAALYMSTGVNMGPFGSLAYWLVQGLNLITGNLDRKGGLLVPHGAFDALKLAQGIGLGSADEHRTLKGNWQRVAGCFPASALAGEIDIDHPERIRALFVSAGNPVHSLPGGAALARALTKLDLVVAIDIYRNETSAFAHYILPATDMLERSDFPVSHTLLQETPHAQYSPAVVPPKHERRPEWQIFSELALAAGARPLGRSVCNLLPHLNRLLAALPGLRPITPDHLLSLLLWWGGRVSLRQLRRAPGGVLLGNTPPGSFLGERVPTGDGRVHLWPARVVEDLPRLTQSYETLADDDGRLTLIGRRERRSHNSWMHNNPHIRQPEGNHALVHSADAAARNIHDHDVIDVASTQGKVRLRARVSGDVRPGVIAVPHGWGHQTAAQSRAAKLPGANINDSIPGGPEHMEPVSGQAIMIGHRVEVSRVDREADRPPPIPRDHRRQ